MNTRRLPTKEVTGWRGGLTPETLEVWTPKHGWLFNGHGHLLHEARSPGDKPVGREWYGAFLPDGRWITTEVDDYDCNLSFFSQEGKLLRTVSSAELAPPGPYHNERTLLGWARSNRTGMAWIVNVGSEEGYATVEIGPQGASRPLLGVERWRACYPRALGARGFYISMWAPDDAGKVLLMRNSAGHGVYVGYPSYSLVVPNLNLFIPDMLSEGEGLCNVPNGNDIFGFWPGGRNVYVGATRTLYSPDRPSDPVNSGQPYNENATWFFTDKGKFQGWMRARRLADAADGRAMLFRLEGSQTVVTLRPDLHAIQVRRFVWEKNGHTAIALSLFDDLRLGLFRQKNKLVLARW